MKKDFGGVIWTNHAIKRMQDRGIKQGDAWVTWRKPDQSRFAKAKGAWVYYKTFGSQKIEVVAKQNEKKEWVILSVWSRPVRVKRQKPQKSLISSIFSSLFKKKSTHRA